MLTDRERNEIENRNLFITEVTFVSFFFFFVVLRFFFVSLFFRFFFFGFVIVFSATNVYCFCEHRYENAFALISSPMAAAAFRCCLRQNTLLYTIVVVAAAMKGKKKSAVECGGCDTCVVSEFSLICRD